MGGVEVTNQALRALAAWDQGVGAEHQPLIFLDIDGVLNSEAWCAKRGPMPEPQGPDLPLDLWHLDPDAVKRLERVHKATNCAAVLSSDWRRAPWKPGIERTVSALRWLGLTMPFVGETPVLTDVERHELFGAVWGGSYTPRWMECEAWLLRNPGRYRSIAIDDCADFSEPQWACRLVLTDWDVGLTDEDADKAIALLRGKA